VTLPLANKGGNPVIIELQRALSPIDLVLSDCCICGESFWGESVTAAVMGDNLLYMGKGCQACLEYFGWRNPTVFPTIEQYEAAKRLYPDPIWTSEAEAYFALDEEDSSAVLAAHDWALHALTERGA
jgi:hypothetical protein